jgi:hypothetical protein
MEAHSGKPLLPRFVRHGAQMPDDDAAPPGFWLSVAGIALFALMAGVIFAAYFTPAMLVDFANIRFCG